MTPLFFVPHQVRAYAEDKYRSYQGKIGPDFAARIEQSPLIPSWIAPTMAIAPIETVSDAVTNPSTKSLAFALPVFLFSHSPNLSNTVHRLTEIIKQLYNPANHALNSMNPHHCGM